MKKLQNLLKDDYEDFESLENVEKSFDVLESGLSESNFDGLIGLVKEYIVRCVRNIKTSIIIIVVTQDPVYNFMLSLHLGRRIVAKFSRNGKFSQNGNFSQNGKCGQNSKVHLGLNVSSSAHDCRCTVNGGGAMAEI